MFYRPYMHTQGVEYPHYEHETLIGYMSKCQLPKFSTQVGIENITLEDKERSSIKKNIDSYSQGMKIHFLLN